MHLISSHKLIYMSLTKTFIKSRKCYKVTFELPIEANPEGKEVRLLGQFNDWKWEAAPILKKNKKSLKTTIELPIGAKYEFRYLADKSFWINDWSADSYTQSPYSTIENCVVNLETELDLPAKKITTSRIKKSTQVDFTKIEGIGPKISEILTNAGFSSYEELASAKKKDIVAVLTSAGKRYQMHDPTTWPKQSKLMAEGKEKALKKLQAELKGGRKA